MNTPNSHKDKGFIISSVKNPSNNRKSAASTNHKSSQKQNERNPKQIIKIVTKTSLNPINQSTKIQSPKFENEVKSNLAEIKKQLSNNNHDLAEKEKMSSGVWNEEEVKNSMIFKELLIKNSALKEELKKLNEMDKEKTLEIIILKQELEKERAEKKKLQERNFVLQKQIDDLKEELRKKQAFISQTMIRQQNEMNELRTLLNGLRFQAENFPLFFMPFARMFNPLGSSNANLMNLDDMSYEQILNLQDRVGYVSRGFTREQIKKIPKIVQLNQNNEDVCSICYAEMAIGEKIKQLPPCNHGYHSKCIKTWLLSEKTCPICKVQVQIPN